MRQVRQSSGVLAIGPKSGDISYVAAQAFQSNIPTSGNSDDPKI